MTAAVVRGDALRLPLPDGCVDLCLTSPPYFALRSYTDNGQHYAGQVGSEPTPAEYVDALIAATREMVRVLKPSGSIWVNLGDKYAGVTLGTTSGHSGGNLIGGLADSGTRVGYRQSKDDGGVRQKSLIGIPWRYALRCIDDLGLILRAEVIWSKPNGLPESVTDRVRRSHEQWFHFTREPRYYSAVDEIREPHTSLDATSRRGDQFNKGSASAVYGENVSSSDRSRLDFFSPLGKLPGSVWTIPTAPLTVPDHLGVDHFAAFPPEWPRRIILGWSPPGVCTACGEGRRPNVNRKPMPPSLKANPLRSGTMRDASRGDADMTISGQEFNRWRTANPESITGYVCACTPYTDHPGTLSQRAVGEHPSSAWANPGGGLSNNPTNGPRREYHHDRWTPAPTTPALILDPFGGTGTTSMVAAALGRTGISVDLSADYCRLARWRTGDLAQHAAIRGEAFRKPEPVVTGQGELFGGIV